LVIVLLFYLSREREVRGLQRQLTAIKKEIAAVSSHQAVNVGSAAGALPTLKLGEWIEEITRSAAAQSVQVMGVQLGESRVKGSYVEQSVRLEVRGRFQGIGEYLAMLEASQEPVGIASVRLENSEALSPEISGRLDLLLYSRKAT
jgi:Tfp pilus assembly protein PilO